MIEAIGRMMSRAVARAPQLIDNAAVYFRHGLPPEKGTKDQLRSYESWVYAAVVLISRRTAAMKMRLVLERPTKTETERVLAHPFLDLIRRPNQFMSWRHFAELHQIFLDLTGNSYWYVVSDQMGVPRELWPLPPDCVWPVPHPDNYLAGYLYYPPGVGEPIRFGLNDIVHFKYPNPRSFYLGASPIKAAAYAYDINLYTHVYERSFFKEGARFDFALQTDHDLTDEQIARVYKVWMKSHQGVDKAWRPAVLSGGLKAVPLNGLNKDFEFASLAKWTKDEILGIYHTPEAMLGHGEQVNRASTDAFEVIFNRNAIEPRMGLLEEGLEDNLLTRYPGQGSHGRWALEFDSPVPVDREMELKEETARLEHKVLSIDEVRAGIGREKAPWGAWPWGQVQDAPLKNLMDNKPQPKTTPSAGPTKPKKDKDIESEQTD